MLSKASDSKMIGKTKQEDGLRKAARLFALTHN